MKFKSLILLVVSVFVLFSCDDGIKFDNPYDINSDAYNPSDTDTQTNDDDSDKTDTTSEYDDEKTDTASTNDDEPVSDDSDSDSTPDDADSIDDSGDSEPDESDSDDDSDSTDSEPDNSDSTPDEDTDTDSGDSTLDEDADTDSGDSTPDQDTDTTPTTPCDPNPCSGITNSTGSCAVSGTSYSCGCNNGYFWNDGKCKRITLGNICTGQTKCYNNTEEITCPTSSTADFYGQDAQYAKAGYCYPQSFTVKTISGKNIVIDNNTGLTWEQSPSTDTYTWDNREIHCNELNSSNYAGKNDWRVPNPLELLTITDNSKFNPATNYFTNMPTGESDFLWTSNDYSGGANSARAFNPYIGWYSYGKPKSETYKVLCVSGIELISATASNFTMSPGNKVATDNLTGLVWQKDYASDKTWQEAFAYCKSLNNENYGGYSDWRLPNKNEVSSLLDPARSGKPYSNFPDMPTSGFWASSTNVGSPDNAWYATFYNGDANYKLKTDTRYVRCVRSEKINDPCDPNPCNGLANSTQTCTQHNAFEYSCGCNSGYFWNGQKCAVLPECSATSGTPCKDSTSHLTWSKKAEDAMAWQTAVNYCNNYSEGGLNGWRLPNISELRTLVQNCAGTVTGGSCGVIDTGDPTTSCLSYSCYNRNNCLCAEDLSGNYSKLGDTSWFWSYSTPPNSTDTAWRMNFTTGETAMHSKDTERYIRCVR